MHPTLCPMCGVYVTPHEDGPDLLCPRCSLVLPGTTAAPKARIGRPPLAPDAPRSDKRPRSIRLGDAHWAKLQQLGTDWLECALDRAKLGDS